MEIYLLVRQAASAARLSQKDPPVTANPPAARLPADSLTALLAQAARAWPQATAAIHGERAVTFAGLHARAEGVASLLHARGIRRGARVGLFQGNGIGFLESLFGIAALGAVAVPFSTWATVEELGFLLADSQVEAVLAQPVFLGRDLIADLRAACALEGLDTLAAALIAAGPDGSFAPGPLPLPAAARAAAPGDDALILYTSGSTSRPKGVRLAQAECCANGFHIGERQGLVPGDRVFLPVPLFWSYGAANALPAAFSHGAGLVLAERFDPETAPALIRRHGCTSLYTLPAMTNALLSAPGFDPAMLASLRTGMTIGTPADVRKATEGLGIPQICNIYGATETYGNCCVTWHHWPLEKRMDCQGPPLPGQVLRMRDPETGRIAAPGQTGLVEVSGRVSPGYTGASAAQNTAAFTEDGFYRTGDLGHLDAEGNFHFVGRASEMIKRAGINVSPSEVEVALQALDGVAQCCVLGIPDGQRDEAIVAFVVPRPGQVLAAPAIRAALAAKLSKYKLPDHVFFRPALPLTATGKVQRSQARAEAIELAAALTAAESAAETGA